jgi:hypothetical protein
VNVFDSNFSFGANRGGFFSTWTMSAYVFDSSVFALPVTSAS